MVDKEAIKQMLNDNNIGKQTFGSEEDVQNFIKNNPNFFKKFYPNGVFSENLLKSDLAGVSTSTLRFTDLVPGTRIRLVFAENGLPDQDESLYEDIIIGATGNYYADDISPVYGIYFIKDPTSTSDFPPSLNGSISYQYKVPARNKFDIISNTKMSVGEYEQFIGDIDDLVSHLDNTREKVTKIAMSRFFKRPVEYLYYKDDIDAQVTFEPTEYANGAALDAALQDILYWDNSFLDDFKYSEHKQYSPFSIYVLRSSIIDVNGTKENILGHIFQDLSKEYPEEDSTELHHRADHMFEKYYIDRYMYAQTAEDMLIERMALIARIDAIAKKEEEEKTEEDRVEETALTDALSANPVYVLDPMAKQLFAVGVNGYKYNSSISYNGEPIDLKEILRYDIDNVMPEDTKISIGNGVYGDVFYHNVVTEYSIEKINLGLKAIKKAWEDDYNNLTVDSTEEDLAENARKYRIYNEKLAAALDEWTKIEE